MTPPANSKSRFSERAENYQKYRPSYPHGIGDFVRKHLPVSNSFLIADIGSGTGISSEFLLMEFKCHVYGIEPNESMRIAAEKKLGSNPFFTSLNGSAEETGLPKSSIDMVTAFQSFHWFDRDRTRKEFQSILTPPKWLLFVWNERQIDKTPFLREYELLQQQILDYTPSSHRKIDEYNIASFMGVTPLTSSFETEQKLDWESLKGRFLSSSYTPKDGDPQFECIMGKLQKLFDVYQQNGVVEFKYATKCYLGRLK